jgi:hypothetical protein
MCLKWDPNISPGDVIQIFVVVLAAIAIWFGVKQFNTERRPVVGVFAVSPRIGGSPEKQEAVKKTDELIIDVDIRNGGLSAAKIKLAQVRGYYAFFSKDEAGKPERNFHDLSLKDSYKITKIEPGKDVPANYIPVMKESNLLPGQSVQYQFMLDAKDVMEETRAFTTSREAAIFIEVSVVYTNLSGERYWYNSIHQIGWPKAQHNTFQVSLIKSNEEEQPLYMTQGHLFDATAQRQHVQELIQAQKSD